MMGRFRCPFCQCGTMGGARLSGRILQDSYKQIAASSATTCGHAVAYYNHGAYG